MLCHFVPPHSARATRALTLSLLALAGACGTINARSDASGTDATYTDAPRTDVPYTDAGPVDAPPPCVVPVRANGPGAVRLVTPLAAGIDDGGPSFDLRLDVYFPSGRVAGAPIVIWVARQFSPSRERLEFRGTLGSDLGAPTLTPLDTASAAGLQLVLQPGQGGVVAHLPQAQDGGTGAPPALDMQLCPGSDEVPVPELYYNAPVPGPGTVLRVESPVPLPDAVLASFHVLAGADDIPVSVTREYGMLRIAPIAAFPPGVPLTLTAPGARDLIGRVITLPPTLTALVTTATATDLTFDTAPPAGSVASDTGALTIPGDYLMIGCDGLHETPFATLIALGDPGPGVSTARIRARWRQVCSPEHTVTLVSADGHGSPVMAPCGVGADVRVPIPGGGPLWLSVNDNAPRWDYQAPEIFQGVLDLLDVGFE